MKINHPSPLPPVHSVTNAVTQVQTVSVLVDGQTCQLRIGDRQHRDEVAKTFAQTRRSHLKPLPDGQPQFSTANGEQKAAVKKAVTG